MLLLALCSQYYLIVSMTLKVSTTSLRLNCPNVKKYIYYVFIYIHGRLVTGYKNSIKKKPDYVQLLRR